MSNGQLSQTTYATRRKDFLAVIDQLRANGSQDELDLPKIAVIGNQSAGKSSIVEAISGISVPRDGGTCTRCVFECRLSSAAEWSCNIKIRREFDASGARLTTEVGEVAFGPTIKKKEDVEFLLRKAQIAVLMGPGSESRALGMTLDVIRSSQEALSTPIQTGDRAMPRFSKNTVCVHLEGPEYTDLTFMDLPGLIAAEDREVVKLVEDIVLSRIQGNCLILLALPMTDDMMNQKALQLARQVDPRGQRTIGVLTKPDMLTAGSLDAHDSWLKVLSGAGPYPLQRGYFCSKQPDDQQRRSGITPADARKAEREFFAHAEPWAKFSDTQVAGGVRLRDRFGLPHLVASLSDSLVEVIAQSLPQLEESAKRLLAFSQQEYDKLPSEPSSEPFADVLQMITSFSQDIMTAAQSSTAHSLRQWSDAAPRLSSQGRIPSVSANPNKLIHGNRDAFSQFREHIYETRPHFRPYTKKDRVKYDLRTIDSSLCDEEDPRDKEVGNATSEIRAIEMDLDDVRKYIECSTTRELPGNVPYAAKVALITSVQESWPKSAYTCADAVRNTVLLTLHECAENRFKSFPVLHRLIVSAFSEIVEKRFESCLATLYDILETEQSPFTQNHHYLTSSTDTWLCRYKEARAQVNSQPSGTANAPKVRSDFFATPPSPPQPQPAPAPSLFHFNFDNKGPNNTIGANSSTFNFQQSSQPIPFVIPSPRTQPITPAPASATPLRVPQAQQVPVQAPAASNVVQPPSPSSAAPLPTPAPQQATPSPQPRASDDSRQEKLNALFVALADLGFRSVKEEDLARLNPPDEYEAEMKVMAEVRGYFKVSYKRVIDIIPSLIDLKFVRAIAGGVQTFLVEKLELGNEGVRERCIKYLQQDPGVDRRRAHLSAVIKRMQNAQDELRRLKA